MAERFAIQGVGAPLGPVGTGWMATAWRRLGARVGTTAPEPAATRADATAGTPAAAALGDLTRIWARHLDEGTRQGTQAVDRLTQVFAAIDRQLAEAVAATMDAASALGAGGSGAVGVIEDARRRLDDVLVQLDGAMAAKGALLASVAEVVEDSHDLGHIADEVQKVAQMSSLLSINARIEAARAGPAGRGFGVVADEVRRLAGSARDNAESIRERVARIDAAVGAAARDAEQLRHNDAAHTERARVNVAEVLDGFDTAARKVATSSQTLRETADGARAGVGEALVQFQFQDRVGQRLAHVRANADAVADALATGWPSAEAVAALEAALRASYTMPDEGRTHGGDAVVPDEAEGGLVLF